MSRKRVVSNSNVTNLQNEYTQKKNLQSHREQNHKRHARRRLSILFVVSTLLISGLVFRVVGNQKEIAKMQVREVHAAKDLKQVKAEQRLLNNQIKQLKDESYVEKIARGEYDLSKDGEIIFNLADDTTTKSLEEAKKIVDREAKDSSTQEDK